MALCEITKENLIHASENPIHLKYIHYPKFAGMYNKNTFKGPLMVSFVIYIYLLLQNKSFEKVQSIQRIKMTFHQSTQISLDIVKALHDNCQ